MVYGYLLFFIFLLDIVTVTVIFKVNWFQSMLNKFTIWLYNIFLINYWFSIIYTLIALIVLYVIFRSNNTNKISNLKLLYLACFNNKNALFLNMILINVMLMLVLLVVLPIKFLIVIYSFKKHFKTNYKKAVGLAMLLHFVIKEQSYTFYLKYYTDTCLKITLVFLLWFFWLIIVNSFDLFDPSNIFDSFSAANHEKHASTIWFKINLYFYWLIVNLILALSILDHIIVKKKFTVHVGWSLFLVMSIINYYFTLPLHSIFRVKLLLGVTMSVITCQTVLCLMFFIQLYMIIYNVVIDLTLILNYCNLYVKIKNFFTKFEKLISCSTSIILVVSYVRLVYAFYHINKLVIVVFGGAFYPMYFLYILITNYKSENTASKLGYNQNRLEAIYLRLSSSIKIKKLEFLIILTAGVYQFYCLLAKMLCLQKVGKLVITLLFIFFSNINLTDIYNTIAHTTIATKAMILVTWSLYKTCNALPKVWIKLNLCVKAPLQLLNRLFPLTTVFRNLTTDLRFSIVFCITDLYKVLLFFSISTPLLFCNCTQHFLKSITTATKGFIKLPKCCLVFLCKNFVTFVIDNSIKPPVLVFIKTAIRLVDTSVYHLLKLVIVGIPFLLQKTVCQITLLLLNFGEFFLLLCARDFGYFIAQKKIIKRFILFFKKLNLGRRRHVLVYITIHNENKKYCRLFLGKLKLAPPKLLLAALKLLLYTIYTKLILIFINYNWKIKMRLCWLATPLSLFPIPINTITSKSITLLTSYLPSFWISMVKNFKFYMFDYHVVSYTYGMVVYSKTKFQTFSECLKRLIFGSFRLGDGLLHLNYNQYALARLNFHINFYQTYLKNRFSCYKKTVLLSKKIVFLSYKYLNRLIFNRVYWFLKVEHHTLRPQIVYFTKVLYTKLAAAVDHYEYCCVKNILIYHWELQESIWFTKILLLVIWDVVLLLNRWLLSFACGFVLFMSCLLSELLIPSYLLLLHVYVTTFLIVNTYNPYEINMPDSITIFVTLMMIVAIPYKIFYWILENYTTVFCHLTIKLLSRLTILILKVPLKIPKLLFKVFWLLVLKTSILPEIKMMLLILNKAASLSVTYSLLLKNLNFIVITWAEKMYARTSSHLSLQPTNKFALGINLNMFTYKTISFIAIRLYLLLIKQKAFYVVTLVHNVKPTLLFTKNYLRFNILAVTLRISNSTLVVNWGFYFKSTAEILISQITKLFTSCRLTLFGQLCHHLSYRKLRLKLKFMLCTPYIAKRGGVCDRIFQKFCKVTTKRISVLLTYSLQHFICNRCKLGIIKVIKNFLNPTWLLSTTSLFSKIFIFSKNNLFKRFWLARWVLLGTVILKLTAALVVAYTMIRTSCTIYLKSNLVMLWLLWVILTLASVIGKFLMLLCNKYLVWALIYLLANRLSRTFAEVRVFRLVTSTIDFHLIVLQTMFFAILFTTPFVYLLLRVFLIFIKCVVLYLTYLFKSFIVYKIKILIWVTRLFRLFRTENSFFSATKNSRWLKLHTISPINSPKSFVNLNTKLKFIKFGFFTVKLSYHPRFYHPHLKTSFYKSIILCAKIKTLITIEHFYNNHYTLKIFHVMPHHLNTRVFKLASLVKILLLFLWKYLGGLSPLWVQSVVSQCLQLITNFFTVLLTVGRKLCKSFTGKHLLSQKKNVSYASANITYSFCKHIYIFLVKLYILTRSIIHIWMSVLTLGTRNVCWPTWYSSQFLLRELRYVLYRLYVIITVTTINGLILYTRADFYLLHAINNGCSYLAKSVTPPHYLFQHWLAGILFWLKLSVLNTNKFLKNSFLGRLRKLFILKGSILNFYCFTAHFISIIGDLSTKTWVGTDFIMQKISDQIRIYVRLFLLSLKNILYLISVSTLSFASNITSYCAYYIFFRVCLVVIRWTYLQFIYLTWRLLGHLLLSILYFYKLNSTCTDYLRNLLEKKTHFFYSNFDISKGIKYSSIRIVRYSLKVMLYFKKIKNNLLSSTPCIRYRNHTTTTVYILTNFTWLGSKIVYYIDTISLQLLSPMLVIISRVYSEILTLKKSCNDVLNLSIIFTYLLPFNLVMLTTILLSCILHISIFLRKVVTGSACTLSALLYFTILFRFNIESLLVIKPQVRVVTMLYDLTFILINFFKNKLTTARFEIHKCFISYTSLTFIFINCLLTDFWYYLHTSMYMFYKQFCNPLSLKNIYDSCMRKNKNPTSLKLSQRRGVVIGTLCLMLNYCVVCTNYLCKLSASFLLNKVCLLFKILVGNAFTNCIDFLNWLILDNLSVIKNFISLKSNYDLHNTRRSKTSPITQVYAYFTYEIPSLLTSMTGYYYTLTRTSISFYIYIYFLYEFTTEFIMFTYVCYLLLNYLYFKKSNFLFINFLELTRLLHNFFNTNFTKLEKSVEALKVNNCRTTNNREVFSIVGKVDLFPSVDSLSKTTLLTLITTLRLFLKVVEVALVYYLSSLVAYTYYDWYSPTVHSGCTLSFILCYLSIFFYGKMLNIFITKSGLSLVKHCMYIILYFAFIFNLGFVLLLFEPTYYTPSIIFGILLVPLYLKKHLRRCPID